MLIICLKKKKSYFAVIRNKPEMFFIVNTHPNRLELLISIMFLVTTIAEKMCSNKSYDRRETVV